MFNQQTENAGAVNHVHDELSIQIFLDFPSFHRTIKNDSDSFTPWLQESLAKQTRKFLIALRFRQKLSKNVSSAAGIEGIQRVKLLLKVSLCRPGIGDRHASAYISSICIQSDVGFTRPPLVDCRLSNAGSSRNLIYSDVA